MNKLILLVIFLFYINSSQAQKVNTPYIYPIKPGSEKWNSFKSIDEMYNACLIPENVLDKLSTPALIETCLNYPASTVIFIYNTPQSGFNQWKIHFNGICELLKRSDLQEEILKYYSVFDASGHKYFVNESEKGRYTFKLSTLELIIAQNDITNKLTDSQQKLLLKYSLDKFKIIVNDNVYGLISRTYTGRIITKMSLKLGDSNLKSKIKNLEIESFIQNGDIRNIQFLNDIVEAATKINTNE
jgi:hypothetical protein